MESRPGTRRRLMTWAGWEKRCFHLQHQGGAASHYAGIVPVAVQQLEGIVEAGGAVVLEVDHWACSWTVRAALSTDSSIP